MDASSRLGLTYFPVPARERVPDQWNIGQFWPSQYAIHRHAEQANEDRTEHHTVDES